MCSCSVLGFRRDFGRAPGLPEKEIHLLQSEAARSPPAALEGQGRALAQTQRLKPRDIAVEGLRMLLPRKADESNDNSRESRVMSRKIDVFER